MSVRTEEKKTWNKYNNHNNCERNASINNKVGKKRELKNDKNIIRQKETHVADTESEKYDTYFNNSPLLLWIGKISLKYWRWTNQLIPTALGRERLLCRS